MAPSLPKPHRPNTSATRSRALPDALVKTYRSSDGQQNNQYTFPSAPCGSYCKRVYGSGYPLKSIGPNRWFKNCSNYKLFGYEQFAPSGSYLSRYTSSKYKETEITGPTTRSRITLGIGESKFFQNGNDYITLPALTRIRLGTEVMLKVGGKKASFGEALAESHKTLHHLVSTVKDLAEALHAARKGKWRDVAKHLGVTPRKFVRSKQTSKRWLEYQYAWLPLMADINDAANVLQDGFRKKKQIASSVRNLKDYHESQISGTWGYRKCTSSAKMSAKVFYAINESTLSKLGQIGLINPLSVAWEVVPFSFVIDWFVPVGNLLEALTAPLGVDFIAGYYGYKAEASLEELSYESVNAFTYLDHDDRMNLCEVVAYTREAMTGFPVPGFYFKSPFSSTHVLSAIALLSQLNKAFR